MQRVRIHLHGPFKQFHPGPIEVVAATAWEAILAVTSQIRGFQPDPISGRRRVQAVGFPTFESLKQPLVVEDIHLMPALSFGKSGGLIQTIIGVVLIVTALLLPPGPWTVPLLIAGGTSILGGVIQMLSPQPTLNANNQAQVRSKYLPSNHNTVAIGTTIGLGYGLFRVGGQFLSILISASDTGL